MTGAIARSVSLLSAAALLLNGASASLDPVVVHVSLAVGLVRELY